MSHESAPPGPLDQTTAPVGYAVPPSPPASAGAGAGFDPAGVSPGLAGPGLAGGSPATVRVQVLRFAAVGATSTVVHLGLFTVFQLTLAAQLANVLALVLATLVNTGLNRAWTFRPAGVPGQDRGRLATQQVQGLLVFFVTWGATSAGLAALDAVWPNAPTPVQVLALILATGVSTVVRFLAMRYWIFARPRGRQAR